MAVALFRLADTSTGHAPVGRYVVVRKVMSRATSALRQRSAASPFASPCSNNGWPPPTFTTAAGEGKVTAADLGASTAARFIQSVMLDLRARSSLIAQSAGPPERSFVIMLILSPVRWKRRPYVVNRLRSGCRCGPHPQSRQGQSSRWFKRFVATLATLSRYEAPRGVDRLFRSLWTDRQGVMDAAREAGVSGPWCSSVSGLRRAISVVTITAVEVAVEESNLDTSARES